MPAWRSMIGYVPQEMIMFHGTVRENVVLGDTSIEDARVIDALHQAGALPFIEAHPQGLDRTVGESGSKLSGGQRQRLALARALVRSPKLLILDEVTAGLDEATERSIIDTLRQLRGRVTVVAISHQKGLPQAADVVLHVDHRTVVEA